MTARGSATSGFDVSTINYSPRVLVMSWVGEERLVLIRNFFNGATETLTRYRIRTRCRSKQGASCFRRTEFLDASIDRSGRLVDAATVSVFVFRSNRTAGPSWHIPLSPYLRRRLDTRPCYHDLIMYVWLVARVRRGGAAKSVASHYLARSSHICDRAISAGR
jgi:hypothetical protein